MDANDPGQPLTPASGDISINLAVPASALAIGAHPDDVEFGCGATLAKWAAEGCVIHHLVCTDGSKGTWDPTADLNALVAQRQHEQREAAQRVAGDHAGEVIFLNRVDGELSADRETIRDVVAQIRRLRPQVVLGHDPWKRYRLHPDHRHAGEIVVEAIVAARDPHFFTDLNLAPHRPETLLLWEADTVHHLEDVTAWVETKIDALAAHVSQHESTMGAANNAQFATFAKTIRDRLAAIGLPHGCGAAEAFARIDSI
ncbi:MAG: PIG-L domain-containing protein [Ilumatobacter coccineus]|uniref:PIG-L domain-containing protein n=1 Tax=Ilumatobacter coccineus TaxID=467094 RepID=A0A2G6KB61_9ACTN|nr:MAG: PIG-L domain-containing protein [Ilumatobacter coccineus]